MYLYFNTFASFVFIVKEVQIFGPTYSIKKLLLLYLKLLQIMHAILFHINKEFL
jgi:hypothetical protein